MFSSISFVLPCITCLAMLTALGSSGTAEEAGSLFVYVGTYTSGDDKGVFIYELDLKTAKLTPIGASGGVKNPSFVELHPNGTFLYAVSEVSGKNGGAIAAFALDPKTGKLTKLNEQSSVGAGPCHLSVDAGGKFVLAANYGGGSVVSLPIQDDGSLGKAVSFIQHEGSSVNPRRQQGPHAHSINLDHTNHFAMAADLGLDEVLIYRFDAQTGKLSPADPAATKTAPGAGPRHFAFHPGNKFAYVINELESTVTTFSFDAKSGELATLQTISTLPQEGFDGNNSTAEIRVHPNGRFLYGSNRGHDSLAIYAIDQKTGKLTLVGHQSTLGNTPRNFNLDPSGQLLLAANQRSGDIVVFRVNQQTGKLTPTGTKIEVPSPVCIRFRKR